MVPRNAFTESFEGVFLAFLSSKYNRKFEGANLKILESWGFEKDEDTSASILVEMVSLGAYVRREKARV